MIVAAVLVAGAFGAGLRVALTGLDAEFNRALVVTFAINVAGAFALGFLTGRDVDPDTLTVLGVGALGAFTTFSTAISHIEHIQRQGDGYRAAAFTTLLLIAVLGAAVLGRAIA